MQERKATLKDMVWPIGLIAVIVIVIVVDTKWLTPFWYWVYDNAPDWLVVLLMQF